MKMNYMFISEIGRRMAWRGDVMTCAIIIDLCFFKGKGHEAKYGDPYSEFVLCI